MVQRCQLYTCDPSVQHKEMEPSLAAAKTVAKLRVGSGLRRTSHGSSGGGSPAGLATPREPVVVHGVAKDEPADVKPAAGLRRARSSMMFQSTHQYCISHDLVLCVVSVSSNHSLWLCYGLTSHRTLVCSQYSLTYTLPFLQLTGPSVCTNRR